MYTELYTPADERQVKARLRKITRQRRTAARCARYTLLKVHAT
jgi:hypothetical protein